MNILFDHQIFCAQKYGGISRYFTELAKNLAFYDNADVKIFAPIYKNEYIKHLSPNIHTGISIPDKIPHILARRLANISCISLFFFLKNNYKVDIFHETYYSLYNYRPKGAKRIITIHDMIHEKHPRAFSCMDRTREFKKNAIKKADHIICVSENTRNDLLDLMDINPDKTSVIHLGHSFPPKKPLAMNIVVNRPYLLYVGKRSAYKNFSGLLKAYAESKILKSRFNIICFGGGNFTEPELSLMKSLGIDHANIIYTSGSDEQLAIYYHSAAAFVYPSLYEGFGIPPLEAMSCNCPVACSNTGSLPEVVGDSANLFQPTDPFDIKLSIEKIVTSSDYSSELKAKGLQRIKLFSWQKCANDTLITYQNILNK
ncbi:glycosyltransferase family 4 protein [Methylomonas sp. HW2-6]|uniref:glycosyltransferase family 4 protein n=1 Tax=Methylomonas sp. HW2-6 TaxID=3376687 RepID=UPI00404266A5